MPSKHVPLAHYEHLIAKALEHGGSQRDYDYWIKRLSSKDERDQGEAKAFIERAFPGTIVRLDRLWLWSGQRAVHLWVVVAKDRGTPAEMVGTNLGKKNLRDVWQDVSLADGDSKIRRIRVSDDMVEAEIWLDRPHSYTHEDEVKTDRQTIKVRIHIGFGGRTPLIQVCANVQHARAALTCFTSFVLPPSARARAFAEPMKFTEKAVGACASKLSWEAPQKLRGQHSGNRYGEVEYSGKMKGTTLAPLDIDDELEAQLNVPNSARRYAVPLVHTDDGYHEKPEVTFHFKGVQPRLQFHSTTSRIALDHVLDALRNAMKI